MNAGAPVQITAPGIYDLPAEVYHADPVPGGSLSSSGVDDLLPPSCPAKYRYKRDHREAEPVNHTFELGHAAHRLVLGVGPELVLVKRDRWDTNEVKAQLAEIRAAGGVPLKRAQWDAVHAMAAELRAHPVASALFDPARGGKAEQSLFWVDEPTGVWRRARLDWLPAHHEFFDRMFLADYKTTHTAAPDKLPKIIADLGYHRTAAWYCDAVGEGLGLTHWPSFTFVFQEKTPPYLVTVAELIDDTMRIGRELNRIAIDLYRECVDSGRWPGYADDVCYIGLPPWEAAKYDGGPYR